MIIRMKNYILCFVIILQFTDSQSQSFDKLFVNTDWLHSHLSSDSIIIFHLDRHENYQKGHIPGALYINNSAYTVARDSLYFEMPDPLDFAEQLRILGFNENKLIIISSGWDTFAHAFRLYVTLEYFGLSGQARILDGGIRGWQEHGFPISQDTVIAHPNERAIKLKENSNILVDKEWVRSNLENPSVCIIDARRDNFYSGREKGNYKRSGHITGAKNLTWTNLVDEYFYMLDYDALNEMFKKTVDTSNQTLIMYCHVGLRASVLYTIGKALGYNVRLYDGSFNEWDRLDHSYSVESN